jgi:predicted TIM-barrel fold metal-dependent hydrolase
MPFPHVHPRLQSLLSSFTRRPLPRRSGLILGALVWTLGGAGAAESQPVFDNHVHLWKGETSLQVYELKVKEAGLELPQIGAMWFGGINQALAGHPDRIREGNDGILALAAEHPRVVPIVTVHPYDGDQAIAELERVASKGAKVLKIHPHTQQFDAADPRVLKLVQRAGELGVITMVDNASIVPSDCEKLFNLALQAPRTKFIFAHLGALNFRFWNILKAARTAEGLFGENIYFDLSATVVLVADSPIADEFVWTIRNVGVDHVLLGSDFPQYSLAQNLQALDRLPLEPGEREKIRFTNAQALFGLPK